MVPFIIWIHGARVHVDVSPTGARNSGLDATPNPWPLKGQKSSRGFYFNFHISNAVLKNARACLKFEFKLVWALISASSWNLDVHLTALDAMTSNKNSSEQRFADGAEFAYELGNVFFR